MEDRQLRAVRAGLVAVEHDEFLGSELVNLTRDLGTDRAAGAGDQDDLALQVAGDGAQVGLDLAAAQQVGDVDLVELAEADATDHVAHRRQGQELQAVRVGATVDLVQHRLVGSADGQDDGLDAQVVGDLDHVVEAAVHLGAEQVQVALVGAVVQEAAHLVGAVGVVVDQAAELLAGIAGAVDEHRLGGRLDDALADLGVLGEGAGDEVTEGHDEQRTEGGGHDDALREAELTARSLRLEEAVVGAEHGTDADHDGRQQHDLVGAADAVTPAVELGGEAEGQLQDGGDAGVDDRPLPLQTLEVEVIAGADEGRHRGEPGEDVPQRQCASGELDPGGTALGHVAISLSCGVRGRGKAGPAPF